MKEKELEQLFNDGLSNLESDVNPNAWANIQQGLKAPAEPIPAITSAAKGGLFSYTGLLLTVAAAGIITAVYFGTKSDKGAGQPLASTQVVKAQPSTSIVVTEQPAASSENQTSNNSTQKPAATSTVKQKATAPATHNTVSDAKQDVHSTTSTQASVSQTTPVEIKPATNSHSVPSVSSSTSETSSKPSKPVEQKQPVPASGSPNNIDATPSKEPLQFIQVTGFRPEEEDSYIAFKGKDVKEVIMTIYDSTGNQVFNSKEYNDTWNGKLKNGEPAPAGKYKVAAVIIDESGASHRKGVDLTIIR